ncbi:unnamed protein product [Dicrocoelium dendriticum]|nr:unnamed protein product [Dicrocoelium dendriticum]
MSTSLTVSAPYSSQGRLLHILPGEEPLLGKHSSSKAGDLPDGQSGNRLESSEFQKTKFKRLKDSAGVAHNWNTLFIQPDAVATYLAAKFNLTKEQVLAPSGRGSVAVRLAHSETQLVAEMREFLQKNGVDLDAFRGLEAEALPGAGRRDRLEATATSTLHQLSGTAFLIKNLPVGTTEAEVRELLSRYTKRATQDDSEPRVIGADPRRVIVPPLGITAIVQYALPQQARFVYRTLAYEPFRDNILYLQWLPHGALKTEPASTPEEQDPATTPRKKRNRTIRFLVGLSSYQMPQSFATAFTVFVLVAATGLRDDVIGSPYRTN